ncbi:MAG: AAA family ATPase, partial [Candidatus Margulisbacteria bacterium]|nr:AAA family ATPase [Candidatus Margulisiibacteriota bacterium]
MIKKVFVAATRQNDGKTMLSLGLYSVIRGRFKRISYMKPVGQHYHVIDGNKIDKDALLIHEVFNPGDALSDMSPIAIPKGFTASYIGHPHKKQLQSVLESAYKNLSKDKEFLLFEGTGHAGVGSTFDWSNASVAKLMGSKVILVTQGGI